MTKNKKENPFKKIIFNFFERINQNMAICIAFLISFFILILLLYFNAHQHTGFSKINIDDFEIGMISDRDVISNRSFEYVDKKATDIRKSEGKHSILPVFHRDFDITSKILKEYESFINFITENRAVSNKFDQFKFSVLKKFPTVMKEKDLRAIYESNNIYELTAISLNLLKQMLDIGIVEIPSEIVNGLNENEITVIVNNLDINSYENIPKERIIFYGNVQSYIKKTLFALKKNNMEDKVAILLLPFISPNIIFDDIETQKRIDNVLKKVQPVRVRVKKNQKIIKRGFLIGEQAYNQLQIYASEKNYIDFRQFFSAIIFLLFTSLVGFFLFSEKIIGHNISRHFQLLILLFFDFVYILSLFTAPISIFSSPLNIVVILPVTFFVMLITALISQKIAVFTTFLFSLAVFGATFYRIQPTIFVLFSGLAGTALIHVSGKRMDLIKTSCVIAIIQPIIGIALMMIFPSSTDDKTMLLFGIAGNGFISGIFVLGFLPILETILNVPTSFRLMELSDLNSPTMKKMLVTVPGTYNHSMMVAALAENACRDIGANPLLARVAGYYHDIGKMENGEYFVENQTGYNKHLDLNPRLSATIIRSHVKLGVEKARRLRLPQEVIDIIAEHHGNGLIAYFYAKAKELDPNVDPEDFSYPGTPPRSKESAVVMLADIAEAACRTLSKPSVPRLEKFIDELVEKKIELGQLDNCDLTFKEVNLIKESFVTMLAGYYHSRIEYPNQTINDDENIENKQKILMESEDNNRNKGKSNV